MREVSTPYVHTACREMSAVEESYDVIVAGAGLAGSMTALLLAKKGFKVLVVEKSEDPRIREQKESSEEGYGTTRSAIKRRWV